MTASRPLGPGDPSPSFELPAVNREGTVSLADYRGRTAVLVGLFRGLHCPFCRRQIARLGDIRDRLGAMGVETLAIVNTPVERARVYFAYRPTRALLAADPDAATHAAFGLPALEFVEDEAAARLPFRLTMRQFEANRIDPTGELPAPCHGLEANAVLNAKDGFQLTDVDQRIMAAHGTQTTGHFLIDRDGIVRWARVEAETGLADLCRFPDDDEIVGAAGALGGRHAGPARGAD